MTAQGSFLVRVAIAHVCTIFDSSSVRSFREILRVICCATSGQSGPAYLLSPEHLARTKLEVDITRKGLVVIQRAH
jgi:hypothetical protein